MTKLREAVLLDMRLRRQLQPGACSPSPCGKGHLVRTEDPIFPPDPETPAKPP